jgi:DNA-binding NtrC family response regulator
MKNSLLNYQFFKSYRLPIDERDKIILNVRSVRTGKRDRDCVIKSINLTGLNFISETIFPIGEEIEVHIKSKQFFNMWDFPLKGTIVRSFINENNTSSIIYGVILKEEDINLVLKYFLRDIVSKYNSKKIKEHLYRACTYYKNVETTVGVELFSLFQSITKDIYKSGLKNFLSDITKSFSCQNFHLYLINESKRNYELVKSNTNFDLLRTNEKDNIELAINNNVLINMHYENIQQSNESIENIIIYPFYNRLQKPIGAIALSNTFSGRPFDSFSESAIRFVAQIISYFYKDHHTSIEKERNDHEIRYDSILGQNETSLQLRQSLELLKNMDKNIMILGENGVNKKEIADYLHYEGKLKNSPIKFYPMTDLEYVNKFFNEIDDLSEMEQGTLILKEIYLLNYEKQQRLYEFLKDKKFRVMTLTSRDIYHLVKIGKFNKKLYFLLSDINIHLPPLRNRKSDVIEIAQIMLEDELKKRKMPEKDFTQESIEKLVTYQWPGNIKQLRNKIKKAVIKSSQEELVELDISDLSDNSSPQSNKDMYNLLKSLTNHSDKSVSFKEQISSIKYLEKNKDIS